MKQKKIITTVFVSSFLLSACGGGGGNSSGGDTNNTVSNVAPTEKSSSGPITSFGSIYVNGRRYDTSSSEVYVESESSSESELEVGMMVDVVEDDNGNAASVSYSNNLEGIVTTNNIASNETTGTLVIMGQTVTVDNKTIFESEVLSITTIDQIQAGNIVEVSGYVTSNSTITATRIEVEATDLTAYLSSGEDDIEIKGIVTEINSTAETFKLGTLTVNYAGALLDDLPNGIQNDLYVEVKSIQGLNASDQLVASKVELEDNGQYAYDGDDGDEYEVKGYVTALSADSISVNEQTFIINANTEFEDNSEGNIKIGDMVEVEGTFNVDGNLVAKEIELEDDDDKNELKGTVASVTIDSDNNGSITLADNTVILVTNSTLMHDERDEGVTPDLTFNLSDINTGDYLEIYAVDNGNSTFTATKIEREDTPPTP